MTTEYIWGYTIPPRQDDEDHYGVLVVSTEKNEMWYKLIERIETSTGTTTRTGFYKLTDGKWTWAHCGSLTLPPEQRCNLISGAASAGILNY